MSLASIAVIGGGIGGLASAIFLARKGFQVTVYEQAKTPGPVGAGFLLQPPGQEVLNRLGVLDKVRECSVQISGLRSRTTSGRTLLDLRYSDLPGPPRHGLGVQRSTIYEALHQTALSLPSISFRWATRVDRLENKDGSVLVRTPTTNDSCDLAILASGSNSQIVDGLFAGRVKRPYSWGCLWTTIRLPVGFDASLLEQRCFKSRMMMGVLPTSTQPDGFEAALYWSGRLDELRQLNEENFSSVKAQILSFWPDAAEAVHPLSFSDFVVASYNDVWTPYPVNGRIVALGDVSHGTSPQLGQGCTMALLDAESLAGHLTPGLSETEAIGQTLSSWWHQRKNQLSYVRHLSRMLTPLYQSDHPIFSLFRDWLMAPMGRLPGFCQLQLKTLASEVFLHR